MTSGGNWAHLIEALRFRDHRLFNTTLAPATVGLWAQRTGVGWLAWDLTHSPTWLGIIAAADLLPGVILSPFAGVIADRAVPLRMLRITQGIIMVHALLLWAFTTTGIIDIWALLGFCLVTGFNHPYATAARMVFFPTLVPHQYLGTAIAINSTVFNAGRAIGPALAGPMIGLFGVGSVYFINFAVYALHLVNLFRIRPVHVVRDRLRRRSMILEIMEGLRYTARHPGIGPMLLLIIATMVARPLNEMLPGFADVVFARGAEGLGWMLAAMGAGGLAGSVWLARRGPVVGLTGVVLATTVVMGAAMTVFALIGNFPLALLLLVVIGFAYTVFGTGTQSLIQTAVSAEVRGRVMSLYTMIFRSMPAIGAVAIGVVAEKIGLTLAVAVAGALCILAWAATLSRRKSLAADLEAPAKES